MKDVTSTSFGLLIAYFLPGLIDLYGLTFWSKDLRHILNTVVESHSDLGLCLAITAAALVVGLILNTLRWLVFERFLCSSIRLDPSVFACLLHEHKLHTFLTVLEETFRYHQFLGNVAISVPFLCLSWLRWYDRALFSNSTFMAYTIGFIGLEIALGIALHEISSGHAGLKDCRLGKQVKKWLQKVGIARFGRIIICSAAAAMVPLLYLIVTSWHLGSFRNASILFVWICSFIFLELAIGANAIFSLRRYIDRVQSMKGEIG